MTLMPLRPIPKGLDASFDTLRGWWRRHPRYKTRLKKEARQVLLELPRYASLDDQAMQQQVDGLVAALHRDPRGAQGQLVSAAAVVASLAKRTLGMEPYEVQLMGALALHHGRLAEMATVNVFPSPVAISAIPP